MNDIIDKSKLLNKNIDVKKNKQALGRGLSALLGEASKTSVEIKTSKEQNEATDKHTINKTELENKTKGSVVLIKIEHVVPNIKQPRKIFNNEKIEDLAKSIKEKGIIQPLIVRKLNESCSDYEIVAGERRFRAASFLKLKEVPCIIVDVDIWCGKVIIWNDLLLLKGCECFCMLEWWDEQELWWWCGCQTGFWDVYILFSFYPCDAC